MDRIAGIPFPHDHLVQTLVCACGCHRELFTDSPEAQQTNSELSLKPGYAAYLQSALDGIADMSCNVVEIRTAICVARNTFTIVSYRQEMTAVLAPARDSDGRRFSINTVF